MPNDVGTTGPANAGLSLLQPMKLTAPPSGLISETLIRRLFSSSNAEHELLMANLGAARTYRGVSGWPAEAVSRELAKMRGETGRDR